MTQGSQIRPVVSLIRHSLNEHALGEIKDT